jgi:hypothetical protein
MPTSSHHDQTAREPVHGAPAGQGAAEHQSRGHGNCATTGYDTARALVLEALPRDVVIRNRPYVVEAERALQDIVRHDTKELAALRGHERTVLSAVFSADGARLLTASDDKTARLALIVPMHQHRRTRPRASGD